MSVSVSVSVSVSMSVSASVSVFVSVSASVSASVCVCVCVSVCPDCERQSYTTRSPHSAVAKPTSPASCALLAARSRSAHCPPSPASHVRGRCGDKGREGSGMLGVECWVLGVECWVLGVGC